MTPTAETIVNSWCSHFWSADHDLEWLAAEVEHSVELAPSVLLMGRIDAVGRDANGALFFGEWKTSSPRDRKTWRQTWRMNPQTLTYGVLAHDLYPGSNGCKRFTVRKAFKTEPPSYDHAWYSYSSAELLRWRMELVRIAVEIASYIVSGYAPWPLNFNACFRYGVNYACPFFESACSQLKWDARPTNAIARVSHLAEERRFNGGDAGLCTSTSIAAAASRDFGENGSPVTQVAADAAARPGDSSSHPLVLDATRVSTWLSCRERFRREYIDNVAVPPSDAMQIGLDCHALWGEYYRGLIKTKEVVNG